MKRRIFTKLLALSPLALSLKPAARPEPFVFRCADCGLEVGKSVWPYKVVEEGTVLCVFHASRHPAHEYGKSLIVDFEFGIYEDGWDEARKQCKTTEVVEEIAQEIVDKVRAEQCTCGPGDGCNFCYETPT